MHIHKRSRANLDMTTVQATTRVRDKIQSIQLAYELIKNRVFESCAPIRVVDNPPSITISVRTILNPIRPSN